MSPETTTERTPGMGYLVGVPAGFYVLSGAWDLWYGYSSATSSLLTFQVLMIPVTVTVMFVAAAVPFFVVRKVAGPQCLASPRRAAVTGIIIAFLTLPFCVAAFRLLDIGGGPPPTYVHHLRQAVSALWLRVIFAGAISGLTYWLIEFAPLSPVRRLLFDVRPLRWTGGHISRRAGLAAAALLTLAACVEVIHWRWRPAIRQSSATPEVVFAGERGLPKGTPYFLRWSSDQTQLLTLSELDDIKIRDQAGATVSEKRLPGLSAFGLVASDRYIGSPSSTLNRNGVAFTIFDLQTGLPAFRGADPTPGAPGVASAGVVLAMSADGTRLAVGYRPPRLGPVVIYDTKTWHRLLVIDGSEDPVLGTGAIALSPDGTRVAFAKGSELDIADTETGSIILTIPDRPSALAFNPAGGLIAAQITILTAPQTYRSSMKIYRTADGAVIASHRGVEHLVWDPKGRFVAFTSDWNHIGIWNPAMPAGPDTTMEVQPETRFIAISPDGGCLAALTGDTVTSFRIGDGLEGFRHASPCNK